MSKYQRERERKTKEVESYLAGLEGEFKEKNIRAKKIVSCGTVVQSILDTAENENVDLIAIASHGWGSLYRVFYGSVAVGVLHRADRPLLIIRSRSVE